MRRRKSTIDGRSGATSARRARSREAALLIARSSSRAHTPRESTRSHLSAARREHDRSEVSARRGSDDAREHRGTLERLEVCPNACCVSRPLPSTVALLCRGSCANWYRAMPRTLPSSVPARVLVVDDFEDTRLLYALSFRDEGFEVVEASDGHEALAEARALPPDLVVMDVSMPTLDGVDAARIMKADPRTHDAVIVLVTGQPLDEVLARVGNVDVARVLTKPCLPALLLALAAQLLPPRAPTR